MDISQDHLRHVLMHHFFKDPNATVAANEVNMIYGEGTVSLRSVQHWFKKFRENDFDLKNKHKSGRPVSLDNKVLIPVIDSFPGLTIRQIADMLQTSKSTVSRHIREVKGLGKSAETVPHELRTTQRRKRKICQCPDLTSTEAFYKTDVKNYDFQSSQHPEFTSENSEAVTIDFVEKSEHIPTIGHLLFSISAGVLKHLFNQDFNLGFDRDIKIDIPGIDMQDKSSRMQLYKNDEWTISDSNLKLRLCCILEDGYGSLLISPPIGKLEYRINFDNIFRRLSKRILNCYASTHWRMDICSVAHGHLLEHLPEEYLVVYVECLHLLYQHKKNKTILDQLNVLAQNSCNIRRFQMSSLIDYMHLPVEQSDENLTEFEWDLGDEFRPVVIHIYAERWADSARMQQFSSVLKRFSTVVDFRFDDSGRLRKKYELLRSVLENELKSDHGPVFVLGWDLGALLGLLSSIKIRCINSSTFCGIICLGLPLKGLKGERGIIPEDYINRLSKETLIISGAMSSIGDGNDVEDFKDRMKGRVTIRHVNIGGCDHILRVSSGYCLRYRISQRSIDLAILREVMSFMVDQIAAMFVKQDDPIEYISETPGYHNSFNGPSNSLSLFRSSNDSRLFIHYQ